MILQKQARWICDSILRSVCMLLNCTFKTWSLISISMFEKQTQMSGEKGKSHIILWIISILSWPFFFLICGRLCYPLLLSRHLNFLLMELWEQESWSFFSTRGLIWWEHTSICIESGHMLFLSLFGPIFGTVISV